MGGLPRRVNFDPTLWHRLKTLAEHPTHGTPDEVQCFDYIYSVLHCPAYRATYAEFLKIDFPRIPWPTTTPLNSGKSRPWAPLCESCT
jgi:hypothetical protein